MSLKLPDKGQWVFIGLVMCLVTYYAGSVSVYFLNGIDWPPESPDNQYHLNK